MMESRSQPGPHGDPAPHSPGVCDCHVHVFDDPASFPFEGQLAYAPPYAPADTLLDQANAAGISRVVLVQPTPYGKNLNLLRSTLRQLRTQARGVGVADTLETAHAAQLRREGVVGLRFIENRLPDGSRMPGTVPLNTLLEILAPTMRDVGMHAEIWAPLSITLELWRELERTNLPVVLDHMGGFDPALGTGHQDFRRLIGLLRDGAVWIKLAACRRAQSVGYDAIRPFHDMLVEANARQLLWATDFPFVRFPGPPPSTAFLLNYFRDCVSDDAVAERILSANPADLYGFGPITVDPST